MFKTRLEHWIIIIKNKNMLVIGFTGKKGCGKTTASDYLTKKYGYIKVGFKDALIIEVIDKFPELIEVIRYGYIVQKTGHLFNYKPYKPEIRALLREYGTRMREIDINYWVKKWKEIAKSVEGNQLVIDDIRFLNEESAVRKLGGRIVRIERPKTDNEKDNHPSEREMDKIIPDTTIKNTNKVKDLLEKIDKLA